jgi:hypothetical protein
MPETKKNGAKKVSKTSSSKTTKDSKESSHQSFSFKTFTSSLQKRWKKTSQGTKIFAVSALLILVVSFVGFLGFQGGNQDADQASASNREIVSKICPDGFTNMDQDGVCVAEQQDPTYGSGDFQFGCIAGNPAGYSTVGAAGVYFCNSPAQLKLLANSEIAGKLSVSTTCQPSAPSGFSSIGGTNIDCGNDSSNTGFWMYATSDIASNFSLQKTCQPSAPSGFSSAGGINIDCGNSSNNLGLHLFVRSSFSVDSGTPQLQANGCPVGYILNTFTRCIETVPAVCPDGYVENGGQCYEEFECPEGGEVQGNLCVATQTSEITAAAECFAGGTLQGDGQTCRIDNGFNSPSGIGNCSAGDIFFISDEYVCGNIVPHSFSLGGQSSCSFPPPGTAYGNYVSSCGYYGGVIQNAGSCGGDSKGSRARCASPRTRYFLDYKGTLRLSDFSYDAIQITDPTGGQAVSLQCPTDFPISAIPGRCTSNNADNVAPQTGGSNTASTAPGICPTPTTFTNIPYQELNATQCYRDLPDGSNQGGDSGYGNCEYGESNYGNNNCPNNGGGSNTTNFADGQVSINKDVPDTVTAGSEVTERIYFDNTASESADSTNITSSIPNGFTLVGGSTKVCLDPEGTDGGAVCTGSSNDFPAIDEGAVWNGGTLSIAPSAGLYGNGSIGTGDLEFGRARYGYIQRNDSCDNSNFAYYSVLEFGNNSSVPFGLRAGCPNGNVEALSFLGQRYAYVQRNENCDGGSFAYHGVQSFGNSPSAPFGLRAGCAAGDVVVRDTVGHRYAYVQRNENCDGGNFAYHGMLEFGNSPSAPFGLRAGCAAGDVAVRDTLDTSNGRGYIEFKMKAPSTNGTFNQSASMNSPEFSEVTDSATITVTGGSGGGDTTNDGPNDANIDGTESNNGNDTNNDGLIDGLENITPDGSGGVDGQTATTGQPTACTDLSNTGCVVDAQGNPNSNFNDNDIDGDGIPNSQDTDMDGDGFNNWFDTDTDQDGINNEFDNDDDNDGIPDDQDDTPQGPGSGDNDGDDIPDGIDADIDGDGDNNGNDLDGDGIIDTDSDGNATGCDDLSNQGCVVDDNGNPNSNYTDDDIDGDGIPNDQDNDIDGDGAPNQVDDDADQDGFTNDGSNPNGGSDNNGGNTTDGTPDTNDDNDNLTDIGNDPNQDGADTNGNDPTPQGPTSNDADIDNDNGNGNGGSNNANDGNGDGIIDGLEDSNSDGNGGQTGTPDYTNCQSTAGAATGSTAIGGTNSNPDCVTDNQGNPNDNYTDTDIDGDGIPNQQDTDMDGDGINNQDDNDVDQDGYNNDIDNDDDNDGIPDAQDPTPQGPVNANNANIDGTEANNGNDTGTPDGIIDGLENAGSDGQGGIEGQTATNNIPTPCNESQAGCVVDSDGVPNSNYTDNDIDGDGIPNDQDDDMDGDGVLNTVDNDIDQDGYNNEFDLDDDNDGILDTDDDTQSGTTDNNDADVDDDGELNGNDTNNDDIIDGLENSTGDGNGGIANQNPSTGANMPTACNASDPNCVINSDGTPNANFDESDIDGDNIPNTQDTDLDGDGVPNWLDNDADQDGYNNDNDLDDDNDGIPDDQDDTPQGPGSGNNDSDNQVDGIDADVDDDGANNGNDLDGDGVIDTDANGNPTGCSDASNPDCVVDGDGVPVTDGNGDNNVDPDIDGDGIPNEDDYDMDGDGSPNTDDDDTDQDGFTNDVDLDDDNDGILDVNDPTPQGPVDPTDADIDNDGLNNGNDTNDDGIIDGLEDAISDGNGGVTDSNGNPITPTPCDPAVDTGCVTDENGIPTDQFQDGDIDGDGTPNTSDTDIDGDGVPNNQDNDVDQDGYNNDVDLDDDNDGILDVNDPTPQGPGSGNNVNAFGIPDCYIYETNPLNGEIFRDANGDPVPSRPCFLFEAFDANDDGDYYFTPEKTNNPIYKEDVTMELFLKNDQVPACQNASAIDITIRTRPVTESNNESAWQDITDTNVSQSNFIAQAEIPLSFRYPGVNIETATKWEFQIDLECDETHYRAEPNYFFATGALALVQVTGTVID